MATPKLAMIPTAYKPTKLYSVLPQSGVGDFTFARASEATRVNEDGLIETMGNNVPRLDYTDGGCPNFLLEPQRTNLFTQSETLSNWLNSQSTKTINASVSPNGSNTANKVIPTTLSNTWGGLNSQNISITSGATYEFSVFAKKDEYSYIQVGGSTPRFNASFSTIDLSNGTVIYESGITSNVESYGNDWYRISFNQTAISSGSGLVGFIAIYNYPPNSRLQAFAGDGTSGVYIWGAQVEQGSYPTSYIPTNGSTVTRVAETCTDSGDASTFNDSEGVFMVELLWTETSSNIYISIDDNTSNNRILIYSNSTDDIKALVGSGGITQVAFTAINQDPTIFNKIAVKYKQNDFSLWINGIELLKDTLGSTPVGLSNLGFRAGGGTNPLHGSTKQIQYFDSALTDAELETLTSWQSFLEMANAQNYTII